LLLGSVAGLFAASLSGSRGALLAVPALLGIVFLMSKSYRRRLAIPTVAAIAVVTALVLVHAPTNDRLQLGWHQVSQYFTEPSFVVTPVGIRLEMARIALQLLSEHPWVGVGFQSFPMLIERYPSFAAIPPAIVAFSGFHSDWTQVIAVGGAAFLLALLGSLLLLARRAAGDPYLVWCLLCAAIFGINELFFCNKLGFSFFVSTWALYAAARANASAGGDR
jgi:O-antigen ligase